MMRKIENEEEKERKKKRNILIISIIMIAILVFSTAGYFSSDLSSEKDESESSGVQEMGNEWILKYGDTGDVLRFSSSPESAKNISVFLENGLENYAGKELYIASESESAFNEIAYNLGKFAGRMQAACYGQCEKNLPEKNCTENLIVYNMTDNNKVYQLENCVFIEGSIASVDAFLYKLFGVI